MKMSWKAVVISLFLLACSARILAQSAAWMSLSTTGGPTYGSPSVVYSAASNRAILFGGVTGAASCCPSFNDVWVLTNANGLGQSPVWIQLSPETPNGVPSPRSFHSAVYDAANNRMIIFGGGQFTGGLFNPMFNDVWVLTNADGLGGTPAWSPLSPSGNSPAPRTGHGAAYDAVNNRMIVFGGANNGIMSVPNDVWVLTNANGIGGASTWIQLIPGGNGPPPLEKFALGYDPASNRITIFGGCCFWTNNTWLLTNANGLGDTPVWSQLFPSGSPPEIREVHAFGYDPSLNELIIFGLGGNGLSFNDTWLLLSSNDLGGTPAWSNLIPNNAPGSPPMPFRAQDPGVYDPVSGRLLLIKAEDDGLGGTVLVPWVLPIKAVATGTISVSTNNTAATFTIADGGGVTFSGSGMSFSQSAPPGTCTITFGAIAGFVTPAPQTQILSSGGAVSFVGIYQPTPPPTIASISPDSGVQGSPMIPLTIIGSNFGSGATVSFTPATGILVTPVATSPNQIVVNLAIDANASPGPRTIAVTNPDAQSTAAGTQFIVVPRIQAAFGTVTLSNGSPLSNVIVTLLDKNFNKKDLTKTNSSGQFAFSTIATSDYIVPISSGPQNQTSGQSSNDGAHGYAFQPSFCTDAGTNPHCPKTKGIVNQVFVAVPKPPPFTLKLPLPSIYLSSTGVQTPVAWRVITETGGYVLGSDGVPDADPSHTDTMNSGFYALDIVPSGPGESFVAPVLAATDGTVVDMTLDSSGNAFGNSIVLRPQVQQLDGSKLFISELRIRYAHLASFAPGIQQGQAIKAGDVLGCMGSTGKSTGVHLHFQVYDGGINGNFSNSGDPLLRALRIETGDKSLAFVEFVAGQTYSSTNVPSLFTTCQ